ncbi:early growth response protein [Penicillium sp. IBT 16267x]|nr:early growth response protein [Penicillium sp. IBT 16267x]
MGGPDQTAAPATALSYQRPLDPPQWESLLGVEDLHFGTGLNASIWSDILDSQSAIDRSDNIWLASTQPPMVPDMEAKTSQMPTPLAEIYDRGCSPGPSDQEAMEPRQYHPTAINIDAQLKFPNLEQTSTVQIDQEDLAHVQETQQAVVDEVAKLAAHLASHSLFPPFQDLRIPPAPILNAWTQLYFEHFHPVFPILHKALFGYPNTHWLLVFTVSAIGAQFSQIPHAKTCSRAMHELIRRQSMFLCEIQNKNGRELWLTQVILLNHIGLSYSGERRALEIAELLQALPVTLARRKQLFTDILSAKKLKELDLSLRQRWQIWTLDEERRRTGFAIWARTLGPLRVPGAGPAILHILVCRPSLCSIICGTVSHFYLDPESQVTLQGVLADNSWVAAWNGTGVLGKQALLQLLINVVSNDGRHLSLSQAQYTLSPRDAEELLEGFLASIEDDETGISAAEHKACGAYRIMILSALMSRNTPQFSLLATAMRIRYQRCSEKEFSDMTLEWKKAPQERRRAALFAARVIDSVRGQYCAHFSTPVLLFRATLTLWLYTILDPLHSDRCYICVADSSSRGFKDE